ncbi:MAG: sensor histidine kinase, partial [Beijerinckiaceae bacterium]
MPIPSPPVMPARTSTGGGPGVFVALSVAIFLASAYWLFDQSSRSAALVSHALDVKRAANELLTLALDAETAQRGYVLTGDRVFLDPYTHAASMIDDRMTKLIDLTSDNPAQTRTLQRTRQLVAERFTMIANSLARIERGERDTVIALMKEGRGRQVMDQIRADVREVIDEEHRLLAQRESDVERKRLLALAPLLLAFIGLGWLSWRENRSHRDQFNLLKQYNERLDELVRVRTSELERERSRVEALLRDVTHRVGNNLAMIASLLNIQRRRFKDKHVQDALEDVAQRIQAMAASQRRMNLDIATDEVEGKPYVENLLSELRANAAAKNVVIHSDLADLRLPGKDAVSYIILVNELVTNAIKHAFEGLPGGTVRVTMRSDSVAGDKAVVIEVEDDGIGNAVSEAHEDHAGKGLGKTVMRALLQSLDGELTGEAAHNDPHRP